MALAGEPVLKKGNCELKPARLFLKMTLGRILLIAEGLDKAGLGSLTFVSQPSWEKENSKFNPAVLNLKIELVSHSG